MRAPAWLTSLAVAGTLSCAAARTPIQPAVTPSGVQFVLVRPEARRVVVAGSFNGWSISAHPLARARPADPWTLVVALPPGEHQFMYVVDGTEWLSPPAAHDFVDDGFGARNGIVVVPPVEP